jgi:hypothetical protein
MNKFFSLPTKSYRVCITISVLLGYYFLLYWLPLAPLPLHIKITKLCVTVLKLHQYCYGTNLLAIVRVLKFIWNLSTKSFTCHICRMGQRNWMKHVGCKILSPTLTSNESFNSVFSHKSVFRYSAKMVRDKDSRFEFTASNCTKTTHYYLLWKSVISIKHSIWMPKIFRDNIPIEAVENIYRAAIFFCKFRCHCFVRTTSWIKSVFSCVTTVPVYPINLW